MLLPLLWRAEPYVRSVTPQHVTHSLLHFTPVSNHPNVNARGTGDDLIFLRTLGKESGQDHPRARVGALRPELHASVVPFVVLCPYLYWYCQLMLEVGESLGDVPRRH
jgi:hypothetical protein